MRIDYNPLIRYLKDRGHTIDSAARDIGMTAKTFRAKMEMDRQEFSHREILLFALQHQLTPQQIAEYFFVISAEDPALLDLLAKK